MKNKKGFWALNIGLLYILPWLVGFILFKVYPFLSSLFYSFTNYDLFNGITKYGMMNYEKIFTDPDIIRAFVVTFKYAIFDVPLKLMFALFIAYIPLTTSLPFWAAPSRSLSCGELYLTQTA